MTSISLRLARTDDVAALTHLYRLAVHPDHRRQGIGHQSSAAAEHRLAGLGATRFDAMVLEGNALGSAIRYARAHRPR